MPTGIYKRTSEMKTGLHMIGRPAWNKDKVGIYSKETLNNIGKNNPNYKGGISQGEKKKNYVMNYNRDYKRRIRAAVVEALGGSCKNCGFADHRALQIDHIQGGGNRERKLKKFLGQGKEYYKEIMESFLKRENKYQVLCANCNWIKRHENNEIGLRFKNV